MADPNLEDKRRRAAELRMAGVGYAQIAKQLGYSSVSGAHEATQLGLASLQAETRDEVVKLELERLDAMLVGLWVKARRGEVGSVDRVLKVMDRRAALLGLDADGSPEVTATGDDVDDLAARRARRRSNPASL